MPKTILCQSAVHQFLRAAWRLRLRLHGTSPSDAERLARWLSALAIEDHGARQVRIAWTVPQPGEYVLALDGARFYTRGDAEPYRRKQATTGLTFADDHTMAENAAYFDRELRAALTRSALFEEAALEGGKRSPPENLEQIFHDQWASTVDVTRIDVRRMNEACTAPEMRCIRHVLGDLRGRTLLDVGCGLGEASAYFAMLGADVTALDVSPGMCDIARQLAEVNGVKIATHVCSAEDLSALDGRQFDVVYAGNTLHHVDIAATMPRLVEHLKADGVFVSWDPVAYNPLINVYRRRATRVRTDDEHPLRLADIRAVRSCFRDSHTAWFWLTTLSIFCAMAVVQRRDPNRERYWKKVIEEADQWAWLYRPLEALDRALLSIPFLRPLCWNVVVVGRGPTGRR